MYPVHQQLLIFTPRPAPVFAVGTVDLSIGIFIYRVIMPALLYRTNIHNSAPPVFEHKKRRTHLDTFSLLYRLQWSL